MFDDISMPDNIQINVTTIQRIFFTAFGHKTSNNTKKISTERLAELLKAERKLDLLEAGGVDNWEGYDSSLSCEYGDEAESYFDFKEKSDEEITSEFEDVE